MGLLGLCRAVRSCGAWAFWGVGLVKQGLGLPLFGGCRGAAMGQSGLTILQVFTANPPRSPENNSDWLPVQTESPDPSSIPNTSPKLSQGVVEGSGGERKEHEGYKCRISQSRCPHGHGKVRLGEALGP